MADFILPYRGVMPSIGAGCFIAPTAAVIGDTVIGEDTNIWFNCAVRGDVNEIRIGARVNVQDATVIHVSSDGQGTYIGDDVTIAHSALVHACTVEDRAFIGMQACVMDDARVETHAMVAAGALVTPGKVVRGGELWAGRPARRVRNLTADEIAYIDHLPAHYCRLAAEYLDVGIGRPPR